MNFRGYIKIVATIQWLMALEFRFGSVPKNNFSSFTGNAMQNEVFRVY
jgi:hypothetical protein